MLIYENENYKPHIYFTPKKETINSNISYENVHFQSISPTKYEVTIRSLSKSIYLNFSESFHPDWNIHVGQFNWLHSLKDSEYFISDKYHFKNDAELNSFILDPKYIKQTFPKDIQINKDGSIDAKLTLYFRPQSYIYLGLIIGGIVLLSSVICLFYLFIYVQKRKK
jgi:hypothetical protein